MAYSLKSLNKYFYYKRRARVIGEMSDNIKTCPYVLKEIITEDGFCVTFNGLSAEEIFAEDV